MPVKVALRDINKIGFPLTLSSPADSQHSIPYSPSSQRLRLRGRRTEDLVRRYNQIASDDIYASSRLSGYLFIFTAYCVLFVSAFQARNNDLLVENDPELSTWKASCTFYGSLGFMISTVFIIAAHFDSFLCPQFWRYVFKLGSKGECFVITLLVLFAIFMVYCSTSTTGLGGFAALNYNVYFSSWAGLVACLYTLDLWLKDSANVRTLKDIFRKSAVKTDYNWACTLFFSVVTLLSQIDTMIVTQTIHMKSSQIMLLSSGASVGCCLLAMIMNACCSSPHSHWHKLEGILLIALSSFWTWVVVRFTGSKGLINGPSNNYFGVWGTFFYSISTFGVWLKENKPICGRVSG